MIMPLQYKIDVVAALKDKGYTSYKIRQEKLLSESTIQKLRSGKGVSWENIETLCRLLDCQPGDLIVYRKGDA
jgi:putative transcriptional regulator